MNTKLALIITSTLLAAAILWILMMFAVWPEKDTSVDQVAENIRVLNTWYDEHEACKEDARAVREEVFHEVWPDNLVVNTQEHAERLNTEIAERSKFSDLIRSCRNEYINRSRSFLDITHPWALRYKDK